MSFLSAKDHGYLSENVSEPWEYADHDCDALSHSCLVIEMDHQHYSESHCEQMVASNWKC